MASVCIYILIHFSIFACGEDFDESDDLAKLADIRNEISVIVGEAACSEQPECRLIGLGAKPCGGPWEYLIYSSVETDTTGLKEKVKEYNDWNLVINKRYEYVSDCTMAELPEVACIEGKCIDRDKVTGDGP